MKRKNYYNKLIEVCDQCHQASCYYGEFMCDKARHAGTNLRTVRELKKLGYEHPDYWSAAKLTAVYGESAPHGYKENGHD